MRKLVLELWNLQIFVNILMRAAEQYFYNVLTTTIDVVKKN